MSDGGAADDEVLLIVAGGESGTCPWRLPSVMLSADAETVRFELGDHEGEPPFHRDPSGELVEVPGEVFLEVRLEPASGHVEDREPAYEGPDRVTARTPAETEAILEATLVADHEAAMTWIVGITDEERPFRIDADPGTGVVRVEVAWQPSPTP